MFTSQRYFDNIFNKSQTGKFCVQIRGRSHLQDERLHCKWFYPEHKVIQYSCLDKQGENDRAAEPHSGLVMAKHHDTQGITRNSHTYIRCCGVTGYFCHIIIFAEVSFSIVQNLYNLVHNINGAGYYPIIVT